MSEPILQFFKFDHLPEKLQLVSKPFGELAQRLEETLPRNAERSVALRKLLEAKDAAVRALIAVAALLVLFVGFPALAQTVDAAAAAPQPVWVTILIALGPFLIAALIALHPLLKLAAFLDAHAQDKGTSALAKTAFLGAESVAKSLDHFLEQTQSDAKDLLDPSKRAGALKHIEDTAKSDAMPALTDATAALGASWITGAASQAIDAAIAKAPAVQVAAPAVSP